MVNPSSHLEQASGQEHPEDLRALLRRETQEIHERLEREISINARMVERIEDGGLSASALEAARTMYRKTYARYLVGAFGFERALEIAHTSSTAAHDMFSQLNFQPEAGPPSLLIEQDFDDAAAPSLDYMLMPMPNLPELNTPSRVLGAEYVRRGSRMGGAVIARVVQQNLGFDAERGARFLNLYGQQLRAMFLEFCEKLNQESAVIKRAEVVEAAQTTFAAIFDWQRSLDRHA